MSYRLIYVFKICRKEGVCDVFRFLTGFNSIKTNEGRGVPLSLMNDSVSYHNLVSWTISPFCRGFEDIKRQSVQEITVAVLIQECNVKGVSIVCSFLAAKVWWEMVFVYFNHDVCPALFHTRHVWLPVCANRERERFLVRSKFLVLWLCHGKHLMGISTMTGHNWASFSVLWGTHWRRQF